MKAIKFTKEFQEEFSYKDTGRIIIDEDGNKISLYASISLQPNVDDYDENGLPLISYSQFLNLCYVYSDTQIIKEGYSINFSQAVDIYNAMSLFKKEK